MVQVLATTLDIPPFLHLFKKQLHAFHLVWRLGVHVAEDPCTAELQPMGQTVK